MKVLRASTRMVNGRYECPMLWKTTISCVPDTLQMAETRFANLERRFHRDLDYARRYAAVIDEYLQAGHATTVSKRSRDRDTWFLPHHAVQSPNKQGKLRVVFDASARTNGICLNDMLLTGPNLLTDLFSLLLRFREYPVAVSADIAKMFHQVLVSEKDRSMLRFLWRTPRSTEPLRHLQMTVHIFGAVCSPTICTYVLRRNAEDHRTSFPDVWRKVWDNFYVDNYLDSYASEKEATLSCHGLKKTAIARRIPSD
uniref:Reverse transcriptase domain-containing protein n=1 Tax=Trichuris muris TaxID=70415 RepID=A0A5S6Q5J7_TRIMR